MVKHIALVEDEVVLCENYAEAFRGQGYEVSTYTNKSQANAAFKARLPDLVLLDIGLEDEVEGGFDICRELRSLSETLPIIFLTARDSDLDKISGLRLGADDYLTKDATLPHILARIAALFRRIEALKSSHQDDTSITIGDLVIDSQRLQAEWKNRSLDLTLTEFWMVHSLVRIPGHVKNREQLMRDANIFVDDGTVTSHIKRVRKKFRMIDKEFDCIETMYGMGYRWNTG
jgi:two-component system OmpR family response regulator